MRIQTDAGQGPGGWEMRTRTVLKVMETSKSLELLALARGETFKRGIMVPESCKLLKGCLFTLAKCIIKLSSAEKRS